VRLATQPVANVTVTLDGLGAYSTAPLEALTFSPNNWDMAQALEVWAAAPTANRPACADGGRYCDEVGGRVEAIAHAVSSAGDAAYDAIEVGGVEVAVSVVRDSAEPPTVDGAIFVDLLNAVVVTFDSATNRAAKSGSFACSLVLDLTAAQVKTLFGAGTTCSFPASDSLKVTFGSGATVVPGDAIGVKALAVQASSLTGSVVSLFAPAASFTVSGPLVPTTPAVTLRSSSESVGRCDDLGLDASGSSGSGGRAMEYVFSVASDSGHSVKNLTETLELANAANGGDGIYRVKVASADMVPGSTFTVTLTATNFLGNSASATTTVTKLGLPAPFFFL